MRFTIVLAIALFLTATQSVSSGCGGDSVSPVTCDETGCECRNRQSCNLNCEDITGCLPSCTATRGECIAECTAPDCEYRCLSADTCGGLCGDNCYAYCSSAAAGCLVETGDDSEYQCLQTSSCGAQLGNNSMATCIQVGACSIECTGTCTVNCIDTDSCNVVCAPGQARQSCGSGQWVCGMDCP